MKWLVTTAPQLDEEVLDQALLSAGAHLEKPALVPLSDGEWVWEVEGPQNLDVKLTGLKEITGVFPSSEMTLY